MRAVCFSADGQLLASMSALREVQLWRTDTWEQVAALPFGRQSALPGLAFHPDQPVLATLSEDGRGICIWELDIDVLLGR